MTDALDCFKAYDVRGRIPDQLNEDIARRIGKAYAEVVQPGTVVVGHDIRLTSESIKEVLPNYAASAEIFADCGELVDIKFMGKDVHYGIDRAYVDVDGIVDKLNKLYYDKKYYAKQAKACAAMVANPKYQWDNIAKKMANYLNNI